MQFALINDDAHLDLVVRTGSEGEGLMLMLNDGAGAFLTPTALPVTSVDSAVMNNLVCADLDNDGDIDLVLGNSVSGTADIVLLNEPIGTFALAGVSTLPGSNAWLTRSVAVGDTNNDGFLDIVTGSNGATSALKVHAGDEPHTVHKHIHIHIHIHIHGHGHGHGHTHIHSSRSIWAMARAAFRPRTASRQRATLLTHADA